MKPGLLFYFIFIFYFLRGGGGRGGRDVVVIVVVDIIHRERGGGGDSSLNCALDQMHSFLLFILVYYIHATPTPSLTATHMHTLTWVRYL